MTSKEIAQHFKSLDKGYVDNWDELLEEKINQFAVHIAEQAVEEEKNEISEGMIQSFQGEKKHGQLYVCDKILSRIKQLTEEE